MRNNRKTKKIIQQISEKIKREYKPERIILFGSHAWGKPDKDSDIDLFIVKDTTKRRVDRFCEVRKIIRNIKGISVQPVVFTKEELNERLKIGDDFIKEILEKGKALYG